MLVITALLLIVVDGVATALGQHDLRLIVLNDAVFLNQSLVIDLIATDSILIFLDAGKFTADIRCILMALADRAYHSLLISEHLLRCVLGRLRDLLGIVSRDIHDSSDILVGLVHIASSVSLFVRTAVC